MPLVNPIKESASQGSRISVLDDPATPVAGVRVYAYGPGNLVRAPHAGSYNLYSSFAEGDNPKEGLQVEDLDAIQISSVIDGKKIITILTPIDFRAAKLPQSGTIDQGQALGMTVPAPFKYPDLTWAMSVDNRQVDPWQAANTMGGLIWPEEFDKAIAEKRKPDLANTITNEATAQPVAVAKKEDGGLFTALSYFFIGKEILKMLGGKGKRR